MKGEKNNRKIADTALGNESADMVITDGILMDVYTGRLLPGRSVAIKDEWIAYVGPDARHTIGENTRIGNNATIYRDTTIGSNCIIGDNAVIGKVEMTVPGDDAINKHVQCTPTSIGNGCVIGTASIIYRGVVIDDNSKVTDQSILTPSPQEI